jgi:hypothetical protein
VKPVPRMPPASMPALAPRALYRSGSMMLSPAYSFSFRAAASRMKAGHGQEARR